MRCCDICLCKLTDRMITAFPKDKKKQLELKTSSAGGQRKEPGKCASNKSHYHGFGVTRWLLSSQEMLQENHARFALL